MSLQRPLHGGIARMFPSFDSWTLDALQSHQNHLEAWIFWGAIFYGLLMVVVGGYASAYNSRLTAALEERRNAEQTALAANTTAEVAAVTERAERAEAEAAAIRRAVTPRVIPQEVGDRLVAALKAIPQPKKIRVAHEFEHGEAAEFSVQLAKVFQAAGWETSQATVLGLDRSRSGVVISLHPSEDRPACLEPMLKAFADNKLPLDVEESTSSNGIVMLVYGKIDRPGN